MSTVRFPGRCREDEVLVGDIVLGLLMSWVLSDEIYIYKGFLPMIEIAERVSAI